MGTEVPGGLVGTHRRLVRWGGLGPDEKQELLGQIDPFRGGLTAGTDVDLCSGQPLSGH